MRPEMKEYNIDWMMQATVAAAAALAAGTDKETQYARPYVPYFSNAIDFFFGFGPLKTLLKMVGQYLDNIISAETKGKKVAATTFCMTPTIFAAMDIVPISFEIQTTFSNILWKHRTEEFLDYCCEVGFTETSCSSQRGCAGAYLAGMGVKIDMAVYDTPGICDTNATAFNFLSSYLNIPAFALNMPSDLSERSTWYHREDFKALIAFLEEQTGKKLDMERLRAVLEETKVQDEIIDEIEELQRLIPNPAPPVINGMTYLVRFLYCGQPEGTAVLRDMLETIRANAVAGKSGLSGGEEKVRAHFCYIEHYNTGMHLWQYLDRRGIATFPNILSKAWQQDSPYAKERPGEGYIIDTTDLDAMIDSVAALNARLPMVKSIRGPLYSPGMWLDDTLGVANLYNADCLIYSGTPGCRNTWGNVKVLASETEKRGYPTHLFFADAFDDRVESWEATEARFDEFLKVRGLIR